MLFMKRAKHSFLLCPMLLSCLVMNKICLNQSMLFWNADVLWPSSVSMSIFIFSCRFTNNLLYYGFSLNTGTLAGSLYINTMLSALVEFPAKLGALAMLQYLGRRYCVGYL